MYIYCSPNSEIGKIKIIIFLKKGEVFFDINYCCSDEKGR
jgi:hypothetical protein